MGIFVFLSGPEQDVDKSHEVPEFSPNELAIVARLHNHSEPGVNAATAAGSLPASALSRSHSFDHCYRTGSRAAPTVQPVGSFSTNPVRSTALARPGNDCGSSSRSSQNNQQEAAGPPGFAYMGPSSSEDAAGRHSRQSTDQYPRRIHYRFASADLEASLLQRMEERQRVQVMIGLIR